MRTLVRRLHLPWRSPLRFWAIVVFLLLLAVHWKQASNATPHHSEASPVDQAQR